MAKGGGKGGGGGGGKGGGGGGAAAASSGGGSKGAAPAAVAAPAAKAAPVAVSAPVSAPQSKQAVKAEQKAVKQETKAAQKTTQQAAKEVKQTGAVANVQAYNKALEVLQATKPKAATKATTQLGKAETKATKKGLISPPGFQPQNVSSSSVYNSYELDDDDDNEYLLSQFQDLLSQKDQQYSDLFGQMQEGFSGQLSNYQNLLSQLQGQSGGGQQYSSVEDDDYQPFDPNLFSGLLGELRGSFEQQREQLQSFKESDEARDYAQAVKAYRF